jgi:glycosyltransferase involved in cell wall biosynthesis
VIWNALVDARPAAVDDGSKDTTYRVLENLAGQIPWLMVCRHTANFGRGRAIRTGFEATRGKFVITLDADLSYSPDHILRLLEPLEMGEADIVLASAYLEGGSVENVPLIRRLLSAWGNWLLSLSFYGRFSTVTCIVRGYTREVIKTLELVSDQKEIHLEILSKALLLGFRVKEIPAHLKWLNTRRSKAKSGSGFLSMLPSISSHVLYNYMFRPSIIVRLPIFLLLMAIAYGLIQTLTTWASLIASYDHSVSFIYWVYMSLRETIIFGAVTLLVTGFCAALVFQFVVLTFLARLINKNFEELFILMNRINRRVKKIESGEKD